MKIGTCHFIDRNSALRWYATYDNDETYVDQLITEGNVIIGKPEIEDDEYLTVESGRYMINY